MFIIIAAVLGISILALPVKSGESGITPVIFNIIACGIFQLFLINYMIELLLRTDAMMKREYNNLGNYFKRVSVSPSFFDMGRYFLWTPFRILFEFLIILF